MKIVIFIVFLSLIYADEFTFCPVEIFPCNILKVPLEKYQIITEFPQIPTIYVPTYQRNSQLSNAAARVKLLELYSDIPVTLSSSNTYSHEKKTIMMSEYINSFSVNSSTLLANESFYLFGNNFGKLWNDIEKLYDLPPCLHCKKAGAVTPGIGGKNSGVSFHYHGPGFSEVIIGSKTFFLYPPNTSLNGLFNPNFTQASWVSSRFEDERKNMQRVLHYCALQPNEILYFPDRWVHATLNMDEYNFFISVFLDTQLMKY